jgi:hypothetical protein
VGRVKAARKKRDEGYPIKTFDDFVVKQGKTFAFELVAELDIMRGQAHGEL